MPWLPTKSLCLCASHIFHDHIPGIFKDTFNLKSKVDIFTVGLSQPAYDGHFAEIDFEYASVYT